MNNEKTNLTEEEKRTAMKLIRQARWMLFCTVLAIIIGSWALMDFPGISHNEPRALQDFTINEYKENKDQPADEMIFDEGLEIVRANCLGCHSAKLITQNRATREGWLEIIRWMQARHNLWELGKKEEIILQYLSKNYAPEKKGRRQNLADVEWYVLKE